MRHWRISLIMNASRWNIFFPFFLMRHFQLKLRPFWYNFSIIGATFLPQCAHLKTPINFRFLYLIIWLCFLPKCTSYFFSLMSPGVQRQMIWSWKSPSAMRALERLCASVFAVMARQFVRSGETPRAAFPGARIRFLT